MEEVHELLKNWDMESLIPIFSKHQITIQALSALSNDDIKELIPLAGPRCLFTRCWRTWKGEFSTVNGLIDLSFLDSPKGLILLEDDSEKQQHNSTPLNVEESSCMILENLLNESLESTSLLSFKGGSLSGDSARNLLAAVVAKKILTDHKSPISGVIYYKWANLIKNLFPGERTTTYYIPACTTANGIVLQAKGKLVNQVLNKRRKLQGLGALPKARKRSVDVISGSPSPRPLPELLINKEEESKDDLLWLTNSSDPWSLVEEKWGRTLKERTKTFYDTNNTVHVEQYFNNYPALKKPHGHFLLINDFNAVHCAYKDNLFINFPIIKFKLFELLKSKKSNDPFNHLLIALYNSSDEETSNIAAFLTIPVLLNTTCVKQKRNRGLATRRWKPSKIEVRDGFIKHVNSSAEISQAVELRLTALQKNGSTSQPYIIIVGEGLHKINTYLVIVHSSVFYETQSIVKAVDTCYKIIWALNVEYGVDTYPVWYFVQKSLYKMTSPFDKGSTATESLLTDCNI